MKFKKILTLGLAAATLFSVPTITNAATTAAKPIKVLVEGKAVNFGTVAPQSIANRTMVPLRAVFEAMNAKVVWDEKNQRVTSTYTKNGKTVVLELTIGSPFIERTISDQYKNKRSFVQKLDAAPQVIKGNTLIPLRASGESLGSEVKWDEKTQTASLKFVDILSLPQSFPEYKVVGSIWDLKREELDAFFATNDVRKTYKAPYPLALNVEVAKVSRVKAKDMIDKKYFDHISPTYGTPGNLLDKFNIARTTEGENIAAGYSKGNDVVQLGWRRSTSGHLEAMLSPTYEEVGVGAQGTTWVELFTTPSSATHYKAYNDRVAITNTYDAKINAAKTTAEKQKLQDERDNALFAYDSKLNDTNATLRNSSNIVFYNFVIRNFPGKFTIYEDLELNEGYQYYINDQVVLTQNYSTSAAKMELKLDPAGINNSSVMGTVKDILGKRLMANMTTFDADVKEALKTEDSWFSRVYTGERVQFEYSGGYLYISFNFDYNTQYN